MLNKDAEIKIHTIKNRNDFPESLSFKQISDFLHENMVPYEDEHHDIEKGLKYALSEKEGQGGYILAAEEDGALSGAVIVLKTGMEGYIPENLILFACVHPEKRGRGMGRRLIEAAIERCDGDIKLHVDHDNPAKKLYERLGFTNKYAEMRYIKGQS